VPPPSTRRRDPLAQLATLLGPPDGETVADWSLDQSSVGPSHHEVITESARRRTVPGTTAACRSIE